MSATTNRQTMFKDTPWLIGLGLLGLIGIGAWIAQLVQGPAVLGTGQSVAWGVYIALFFMLAGTGSGLVVLMALGDLEVLPALKAYRRGLLLAALACFITAGITILIDAGKPERVLNLVFSPNLKSMFVWDFYSLTASVLLAAACLYLGPRGKAAAILAAIAAMALVVVEGLILAVSAASPIWHGVVVPVTFAVDGLVTALALLLLATTPAEITSRMVRWLALGLAVLLALSVMEVVAVGYGGNPDAAASLYLLTSFGLAPLYWGQLLLGLVLPIMLLAAWSHSRPAVILAAVLALAGVFVSKVDLLVAGQALPFMQPAATYVPAPIEVAGVVGMMGLAAFLFVLGRRWIPWGVKS
jgi:dimethyl sulfoxide reductase membrane subunit